MANTSFWQFEVSMSPGLPPGGTWADNFAWGFPDGSAVSLMAHVHPWSWQIVDAPSQPGMNTLAIDNVRSEADDSGRRIFFDIRNAGDTTIFAFEISFGIVSA